MFLRNTGIEHILKFAHLNFQGRVIQSGVKRQYNLMTCKFLVGLHLVLLNINLVLWTLISAYRLYLVFTSGKWNRNIDVDWWDHDFNKSCFHVILYRKSWIGIRGVFIFNIALTVSLRMQQKHSYYSWCSYFWNILEFSSKMNSFGHCKFVLFHFRDNLFCRISFINSYCMLMR